MGCKEKWFKILPYLGLEPSEFCYQIMETTYYKQDSERGQRVPQLCVN